MKASILSLKSTPKRIHFPFFLFVAGIFFGGCRTPYLLNMEKNLQDSEARKLYFYLSSSIILSKAIDGEYDVTPNHRIVYANEQKMERIHISKNVQGILENIAVNKEGYKRYFVSFEPGYTLIFGFYEINNEIRCGLTFLKPKNDLSPNTRSIYYGSPVDGDSDKYEMALSNDDFQYTVHFKKIPYLEVETQRGIRNFATKKHVKGRTLE